MPRTEVRETLSTSTNPPDAGLLQPEMLGVGHGADRHEAVRADEHLAVGQLDVYLVALARDAFRPATAADVHAAPREGGLEHRGGLGVLTGEDPVT
jgi:hypothetical protein